MMAAPERQPAAVAATAARTEADVVADAVVRLGRANLLITGVRLGQVIRAVGITAEELDGAKRRAASTLARMPSHADVQAAGPPERQRRFVPQRNSNGTKYCPQCVRHLPMDAFDPRSLSDRRPRTLCRECSRERATDRVFTVVRRAQALHAAVVWFEALAHHDIVGAPCARCGHAVQAGERVGVEGNLVHFECPR